LAEERKKNQLLRETLDTRERTIIELQAKINELMKVIVAVSIFCLYMMLSDHLLVHFLYFNGRPME